jgi:hypothetical protein
MRRITTFVLLALAVGFAFGLTRLFQLRFESGDVYPPYSSLRSDPVGSKALYESLEKVLGDGHLVHVRGGVERNYRPLAKGIAEVPREESKKEGKGTLLLLGVPGDELECEPDEFAAMQSFVRAGGRLVIALVPSYDLPRPGPRAAMARAQRAQQAGPPPIALTTAWNFSVAYAPALRDARGVYRPASATLRPESASEDERTSLPSPIEIHSALVFTNLAESWRVVYERRVAPAKSAGAPPNTPTTAPAEAEAPSQPESAEEASALLSAPSRDERPVVIERQLGGGTITLAVDSYYFSNEALLKHRQPELIAWFIGPHRKVIFDETHLGVNETPGMAALVHKYHLHGLVAGLVVLAALFVWKSSSSLIPREPQGPRDAGAPEVVLGRESAAGFINVMRRNIRKNDLLAVCLTEWRQSCSQRVSRTKLQDIQRVIDEDNARERPNPVRVYREIGRILNERKLRTSRE